MSSPAKENENAMSVSTPVQPQNPNFLLSFSQPAVPKSAASSPLEMYKRCFAAVEVLYRKPCPAEKKIEYFVSILRI
jgi:hypothetical protein